jgi:hypothetical protein
MVACVILVVITTITVPRLFGNEKREFDLFVDRVADLLTMYAQREQLTTSPVGLRHDLERRELQLVLLSVDPTDPDALNDWIIDRHVTPVRLPESLENDQLYIRADGEAVDITQWPLTCGVGERRPGIELVVEGDTQSAVLVLSAQSVFPRRADQMSGSLPSPIDLDDMGMDREDW